MKNILFLCFVFILNGISAQSYITQQQKSIILTNGIIHVGNGNVIDNGVIGFENGKITFVGNAQNVKYDASIAQVINVAGKHIYPGLIALNSQLGLKEIDLARATLDITETGQYNPEVRSIIAYNTDSKIIPTVRTNGILLAQITPSGGIISGTSSVVQLDAWNWQDAAYKTDNALHITWPSYYATTIVKNSAQISINKNYAPQVNELQNFFNEAKAYTAESTHAVTNLKFEAMRGIFNGSKKLFINASTAKEIIAAVKFAQQYKITPVIAGAEESYLITDFLKENNIPVLLKRIHTLPISDETDINLRYKLPAILQQSGILFGVSLSDRDDTYWNVRNLAFEAGTAVAFGLTKEQALASITLNNAKILGIDSTAGSLEVGKDATLIVSDGDILDMRTNKIIYAYIQGREIDVKNWQNNLYEKYSKKYGIEIK